MTSSISGFSSFISVPPNNSTSSSNNTMPPRPSNSDLIHQAIFGSLSGWLLTLTQNLTCVLRSVITMLAPFNSVSAVTSTSRRGAAGAYDQDAPLRPWEKDFIASLHTIYAYLTGLLLTLTGIKYQRSSTDPFSEHPTLMMLFLIASFVYFIALITLTRSNHMSDHDHNSAKLMVGVCHICGGLACEFLLLVLVSPIKSLLINLSALAVIVMSVLCYKYLSHLLRAEGTEEQGSQRMRDLEAGATIPTAA